MARINGKFVPLNECCYDMAIQLIIDGYREDPNIDGEIWRCSVCKGTFYMDEKDIYHRSEGIIKRKFLP